MSKHKKQHYVPASYLKAWCDAKCPPEQTPYIWIFEKNSKTGRKKSPENIFHETDMYTIRDKEGGRDLVVEHSLSQLESKFADIRRQSFNHHRKLSRSEHFLICVFIAALHARTKSQLQHMTTQWRQPLEKMDRLNAWLKTATEEEKRNLDKMQHLTGSNDKSISYDDIKAIVDDPIKNILIPLIQVEAPLLARLDFAILCANSGFGFITSDTPCTWFDPKAYTRPPFYRGAALMYETIEITLPISPRQCICLNRRGINGYFSFPENSIKEYNKRTRFCSSEYFVVNQNYVDDVWFDPGVEPDDSWEKEQAKKRTRRN